MSDPSLYPEVWSVTRLRATNQIYKKQTTKLKKKKEDIE